MVSRNLQSHAAAGSSTDRVIYILGPIQLQNMLIASFFQRSMGTKSLIIESFSGISAEFADSKSEKLLLWDRFGKNVQDCLLEYESNLQHLRPDILLAFFNLSRGLGIEEKIIPRGVQGFFYREDPLEHLAKGIKAIFEGELWVSRKIMYRCIRKEKDLKHLPGKPASMLTLRELEILSMVAAGATNVQIAEKLFISRHTVKTHLYNIFKKIKVPNRLQAVLWSAANL